MRRRPNLRETNIYWLFDNRTNVPFYCGKTVDLPRTRLLQHFQSAVRFPNRDISKAIRDIGESNVRVDIVEIVPVRVDWVPRECHWIAVLRRQNPLAVNITAGGQGLPGLIHSPEARAKISAAHLGKKKTPESCAKRSALLKGRKQSPDHVAKRIGLRPSDETRAKMRAARDQHTAGTRKGHVRSEAERTKMRAGWARRRAEGKKRAPTPPEVLANMASAQRRRHANKSIPLC